MTKISALLTVAVLVCTLIATALLNSNPLLTALGAAALLFIVLLVRNYSLIVHACILGTVTARTQGFPRGFRVGYFVYYQEILIFGVLVYVIWLLRSRPDVRLRLQRSKAGWVAMCFGLVVIVGVARGLLRGHTYYNIQYDVRSIIDLLLVTFVASVIFAADDWRRYTKTLTVSLIFSALLMMYASVTGMALGGRTETAQLYAEGGRKLAGGSDAVRYLSDATVPALAITLVGTALLIMGRARFTQLAALLIPSVLISVLAFSRITLLALAGAAAFAVVVTILNGDIAGLLRRLILIPVTLGLTVLVCVVGGSAFGAQDWINTQAAGYANRVLAGLEQSNERLDTSVTYREKENEYIRETGAEHPLIGGGFGQQYKPASGKRGTFTAAEGTLYTHNIYNWFYIKIGLIGLGLFIALIAACATPALVGARSNAPAASAAAALVGSSLAMMFHPMAMDILSYATIGVIFGVCIGAGTPQRAVTLASDPVVHRAVAAS